MGHRYIGSKRRLIKELIGAMEEIQAPPARVADLMCGTAVVSEALRAKGYEVVAADLLTFPVLHAKVGLLLSAAPDFKAAGLGGYLETQDFLQNLPERRGFFWNEYSPEGKPGNGSPSRMYLSSANAGKLDAMLCQLSEWSCADLLSDLEHALLKHDIILAVNSVANIAGTYGHFRSKWNSCSLNPIKLLAETFTSFNPAGHSVLQGRAEDLAATVSCDICYLDPPYIKRQYAANYHLLETIAQNDEPDTIGVSGLRDWWDQHSSFCSKVKVEGAFREVLEGVQASHFLVSYSNEGLLTKDQLMTIFGDYGTVSLNEIQYQRFKSRQDAANNFVTEFLFHIKCD